MKCQICNCEMYGRKSIIKAHMNTKKHIEMHQCQNTNKKIDFIPINEDGEKKNLIRAALFTACHTSIVNVNHLIYCVNDVAKLKLSMSRTKCTGIIINVISEYFKRLLKADIGDSTFSLLIDESTDISIKKYLGVVIRYFSQKNKRMLSVFLQLVHLKGGKSIDIYNGVNYTLHKFSLSIMNMHGLGTDNASVMVGALNSVHQKLILENPNIILVPCMCHSLQLAVSKAADECLPDQIEFLIAETYNWFAKSSHRQTEYKRQYKLANEGENHLKIVRSCNTRWMSIHAAIKSILSQWDDLKSYFTLLTQTDSNFKIRILSNLYKDNEYRAYVIFLQFILEEVNCI